MRKLMISAFAVTLAGVWTAGPAIAQDTTKDKVEQKVDKIEDKAEKKADKLEDKAQRVRDKAQDKAERVEDKGESKMDKLKDKTREAKDKVKDKFQSTKDKMASKADRSDVKSAQQALKDKGFDPGPIDGVHGPRTMAAVRDFQKAENMTVTGQLDDATRAKLNVTTSKTDSTAPAASPATDSTAPAKKAPQN